MTFEIFEYQEKMQAVLKTDMYFPQDIDQITDFATMLQSTARTTGFIKTGEVKVGCGSGPRREGLITVFMDVEYKSNHECKTTNTLFG